MYQLSQTGTLLEKDNMVDRVTELWIGRKGVRHGDLRQLCYPQFCTLIFSTQVTASPVSCIYYVVTAFIILLVLLHCYIIV